MIRVRRHFRTIVAGSRNHFYKSGMAPSRPSTSLTIRDPGGMLRERLRLRAARSGRSVEAEAQTILRDSLHAQDGTGLDLAEAIRRRVSHLGGVELDEHPAVSLRDPPRLSE
jgi:plasmid stability protein